MKDNKPACRRTCAAQNQTVMQENKIYQQVVDKAEKLNKA
jgi:hypothetical protein